MMGGSWRWLLVCASVVCWCEAAVRGALKREELKYGLPKDPLPTKLQACCACNHYVKREQSDCKRLYRQLRAFQGDSSEDFEHPWRARKAKIAGKIQNDQQISPAQFWGNLDGFFVRLRRRRLVDSLASALHAHTSWKPATIYQDGIARERIEQLNDACDPIVQCLVGHCPSAKEESNSFMWRDKMSGQEEDKYCWNAQPLKEPAAWGQQCDDLPVYPQCDELPKDRWSSVHRDLFNEHELKEASEYDVPLCCVLQICDPVLHKCPAPAQMGAGTEVRGSPTPYPTPPPTPIVHVTRRERQREEQDTKSKLEAFDRLRRKRRAEKIRKKKQRIQSIIKRANEGHQKKLAAKKQTDVRKKRLQEKTKRWGPKDTWSNQQWKSYCTWAPKDVDCVQYDDDDEPNAKKAVSTSAPTPPPTPPPTPEDNSWQGTAHFSRMQIMLRAYREHKAKAVLKAAGRRGAK